MCVNHNMNGMAAGERAGNGAAKARRAIFLRIPFEKGERQKNTAFEFESCVIFWRARRDSNPRSSESELHFSRFAGCWVVLLYYVI